MYPAPKFQLNLLLRSTCFQGSSIFTKLPAIWRSCDIDDELLLSFHRTTELLLMVFHIKPLGGWEETSVRHTVGGSIPSIYAVSHPGQEHSSRNACSRRLDWKSQAVLWTPYRGKRGCHHLCGGYPQNTVSWIGRKDMSENIGKESGHSLFLFHSWWWQSHMHRTSKTAERALDDPGQHKPERNEKMSTSI